MADIIQQRRDTAARWAQYNPILLEGEVGYVTDNPNQYKIGNGRDRWNNLPLRGYTGTIAQDTGDDENAVMSQKAVTEKLSELGSQVKLNWLNNMIMHHNGNISDNELYRVSNLMLVRKGTDIRIISDYTSYVAIINEYTCEGVFVENIITAGADSAIGNLKEYFFHAQRDMYIRICYRYATPDAIVYYMPEYAEKKVIFITGFGNSGVAGGVVKNGDIYYNIETKKLLQAVDIQNLIYETIPADNVIISHKNVTWTWNGSNLVPEKGCMSIVGIGKDGFEAGFDEMSKSGGIFFNTTTQKFRVYKGYANGTLMYEDVFVEDDTLILCKNILYVWRDGSLSKIGNSNTYENVDLSNRYNFHTQYILKPDGTFSNGFNADTIDSYCLAVKQGEVYHITSNAGANQIVVVGLLSDTIIEAPYIPLLVKLSDDSQENMVYDDDFTIPENVKSIMVMGRNSSNAKYNEDYPLTLHKKVFNEKSYLSSDYQIDHFRVKINEAPYGKFNDADGNNATLEEDKVSYRIVTGGVILPKNYNENGTPCRAIMVMMGGHGYMNDNSWYPSSPDFMNIVVPYFLERGYAVFGCCGFADMSIGSAEALGLTNNLGLPDTIEAYWKSYLYVTNNYNIKPQIHLWGGSQGGIAVMNFTAYHPNVVASVACMAPLLDLSTTGWNETGGRKRIAKILGFAGTSIYEEDKANVWNPMKRIVSIDNSDYYFGFPVPIKMCYGTADEVLGGDRMNPFKRMSQALINGGARCFCKWYTDYNHMDVAFGFKEVVRQDICNFFDRF